MGRAAPARHRNGDGGEHVAIPELALDIARPIEPLPQNLPAAPAPACA